MRARLLRATLVVCGCIAAILIFHVIRNADYSADSGRQAALEKRLERFKSVPYTSLTKTEVDS